MSRLLLSFTIAITLVTFPAIGRAEEKPTSKTAQEDPAPAKPKLRQVTLAGNYVDLVQPLSVDPLSLAAGLTPVQQKSFYRLCEFLEDLAEDKRYAYVAFDLSAANLSFNPAQLDELSRHLKRLRRSGKKTFAWLENASSVHLSVAAQCDEVILADIGGVDLPSVAMQSIFYRDAMDLFGIKASVVRAGDFKGAVEPYLQPQMSEHLRAQYVDMLETMNRAQVDRIARGRGIKPVDVRACQQQRLLLPKEALAAGLVDALAPLGSMRSSIEKRIDESVEWVTAKAAAQKQLSVFQLMGQIMAGPTPSGGRIRDNTIAVIHLSGVIVDGKKASSGNIVSGPTVSLVRELAQNEKIVGAVVRINSPGGSATASESIRRALAELAAAKPTILSMGETAASGGYWISCIDCPVYAERGTLTGSIGVFSMKLSAGALLRRVGVHLESVTLDESAAAFSLDRLWTGAETKSLQRSVDMFYTKFLKLVSQSRGLPVKKLERLAGGRVWSGSQAKRHQLVDHLGGVDDCLEAVAKQAGIDDFHVVHRPIPRSGLDLSELLGQGGEEELRASIPPLAKKVFAEQGISLSVTRTLVRESLRPAQPKLWLLQPAEILVR